jgi:hypothetical protein
MSWEYLLEKQAAISYLKTSLSKGELVLFLGAGASKGLGLPDWTTYINLIRTECGLKEISPSASADELQLAADEIRINNPSMPEYFKVLKKCLYSKLPTLNSEILQNKLLISLGTLLMSSKRGSIKRVVTLNYDSMLEWYLKLCGFVVRIISKLPHMEGSEDVSIYHPHGFLPHPSLKNLEDSDFILLDFKQANAQLSERDNPYYEKTRYIMRSGLCLFVGMSENTFDDRLLAPILVSMDKEVHKERPTGFWFIEQKVYDNKKNHFRDLNVVPIPYSSVDAIPDFILEICQNAAIDFVV